MAKNSVYLKSIILLVVLGVFFIIIKEVKHINDENFTPKINRFYNSNVRKIKNTTNKIIESLISKNNIIKTLKQYNVY